jgi:hypothetical protein
MRPVIFMFITFCLLYVQKSFGQLPSVKASIDKNNILIGQQLNYRVQTSMPDNTYRLNWFSVPDSFGHFVVVAKNKIDSAFSNGNLNFSQVITLTNFDSGRQVIPPITFSVATLEGDSAFTISTDSFPVNVSYSPLDSIQPFHDIKTIIEVKKVWPWWVWALLATAIILLIGWIIFLIKFFKKKKAVSSLFTSSLSPYDEALQSLSELAKEKPAGNNSVKEYYSRLTAIFKRYLSRKTNTYQLHLTSDEILMELNEFNFSKEQIAEFASSLRMGNAVKFAQYIPPGYENEKCLSQVKEMIVSINNFTNKKTESDL